MFYFIRVNGYYVPGKLSPEAERVHNSLNFCLDNDVVRIGWPETGDLRCPDSLDVAGLPLRIRNYLEIFRSIRVGSVVVVPDRNSTGHIYMGEVTTPYHYVSPGSLDTHESGHCIGVRWDRDISGNPVVYHASSLALNIHGGFWCRALFDIGTHRLSAAIVTKITACRTGQGERPSTHMRRIDPWARRIIKYV